MGRHGLVLAIEENAFYDSCWELDNDRDNPDGYSQSLINEASCSIMPISATTLDRAAKMAATAIAKASKCEHDLVFVAGAVGLIRESFLKAESEEAQVASISETRDPYLVGLTAGRIAVVPLPPYSPGSPEAAEWIVGYGAGISQSAQHATDEALGQFQLQK